MSTVLESLAEGSRVAVLRLRSLGDSVLTTPALKVLKSARPDLEIDVLVEPRFSPVFDGNPDVSAILAPRWRELRAFRPDLCLTFHNGTLCTLLTALSGAPRRAAFAGAPYPWIYNVHIPRAQQVLRIDRKVHTAEHLAAAMFYLGVPPCDIPRARLFVTEPAPPLFPQYAILHPAASHPSKTWPAESYLLIAKHLSRNHRLEPVFIGGPGDDLSPFQAWPSLKNCSLSRIKTALKDAALFVGNDSGPAHVAAAFGIPCVVIFGPSDPVVWAPWRTASETLVANGPIQNVTPEQVVGALDRVRIYA